MRKWFAGFMAAMLFAVRSTSGAQAPKPATGSLIIAFAAEATMLDPVRSAAGVDQYFIGQMFEQLTRTDPSLNKINWLAERWDLKDEGGKPYLDIQIRKGVKFHNGDPLTAADFEYSFRRASNPKISRWTHLQAQVEAFEIIDDHHFLVRFKEGDGSYVANDLVLWAIPKNYVERVGDEEFARNPVGTGPWKFVSRTIKDEIRFEAFDDYWNTEHRPTVKTLIAKVIPEDLTRVAAFKTGAIDWIDAVPPAMVEEFKKLPNVKIASFVSPNNLNISMDALTKDAKFQDVRVRQALAHAIDVDAVIKTVLFGQGERYVEVGKGSAGYDPELKPYPYDPKKARELLKQAGFPMASTRPATT